MDNPVEITLTRTEGSTYSWKPQSRLSRLLATLGGLALLSLAAAFAVGFILAAVAVVMMLVVVGLVRAQLRRGSSRRHTAPPPPAFFR